MRTVIFYCLLFYLKSLSSGFYFRKLIAVVETTDKYPVVTLWDPELFKKRKTLTLPPDKDINANRYVCIDFTYDSKYLVCVAGEPDWNLFCFKCDKGRLESFAKANNLNGIGTVLQVNNHREPRHFDNIQVFFSDYSLDD